MQSSLCLRKFGVSLIPTFPNNQVKKEKKKRQITLLLGTNIKVFSKIFLVVKRLNFPHRGQAFLSQDFVFKPHKIWLEGFYCYIIQELHMELLSPYAPQGWMEPLVYSILCNKTEVYKGTCSAASWNYTANPRGWAKLINKRSLSAEWAVTEAVWTGEQRLTHILAWLHTEQGVTIREKYQ